MSQMIMNSADEVNGVFKYNINGFNEIIGILIKIDPETYIVEGGVFSVIKKGIDVEMFNLENIMQQEVKYIIPSKEIKGPNAFQLILVEALKYVYLNRDNYMPMVNEEIVNISINDILYIDGVRDKRISEKAEEKSKSVLGSIKNLLKVK